MSIRITGGDFSGRNLPSPPGRIRPTAARVRGSFFDILGDISGLSFCDLFSGSGAVGIEAAGRGAAPVIFVEKDRRACSYIRKQIGRFGLPPEAARIRPESVKSWISRSGECYDLLFADPPYIDSIIDDLLESVPRLIERLTPAGILIIQLPSGREVPGTTDMRQLGDDTLHFWEKWKLAENPDI